MSSRAADGFPLGSPMSDIPVTPLVRGHIDSFQACEVESACLAGWIFCEGVHIQTIDICLGGQIWVQDAPLFDRPEIELAFASQIGPCPHATHSGFSVTAQLPPGVKASSEVLISITPHTSTGKRLNTLQSYYCAYESELRNAPQPPAQLQERIGGSKDFVRTAAQLVSLILTSASKYKPIAEMNRILDWGCGCGRVIAQLLKLIPPRQLFGCDIDAEAIAWNLDNLHGPGFTRISPYPPTPYPDGYFDLIYGISVMTHLDEKTQMLWLTELRRIANRGGILVLSVISEALRSEKMPAVMASEFARKGFVSIVPNYSDLLSQHSHQNYYQEAYHSFDYIASCWGQHFDVLEFVITKHQDLVILRSK